MQYKLTDYKNIIPTINGIRHDNIKEVIYLDEYGIPYTVWVQSFKTATPGLSLYHRTGTSIRLSITNNDSRSAYIYIRRGTLSYVSKGLVAPGATVYHDFTGLSSSTTYSFTAYAQATGSESSDTVTRSYATTSGGGIGF